MLRGICGSLYEGAQIRMFGLSERTLTNEEGVTYKIVTYSRKEFKKLGVDNFNREVQEIEGSLKKKSIEPHGKKKPE
jgi:hypothetical protein